MKIVDGFAILMVLGSGVQMWRGHWELALLFLILNETVSINRQLKKQ